MRLKEAIEIVDTFMKTIPSLSVTPDGFEREWVFTLPNTNAFYTIAMFNYGNVDSVRCRFSLNIKRGALMMRDIDYWWQICDFLHSVKGHSNPPITK